MGGASSKLLEAGTEQKWGGGDPPPCLYLQRGPGFPSAPSLRLPPTCPWQMADWGTPQPPHSREPVPYHEGINLRGELCYWSSWQTLAPLCTYCSEARSFHGLLTPAQQGCNNDRLASEGAGQRDPGGPRTLAASGEPAWTAGLTQRVSASAWTEAPGLEAARKARHVWGPAHTGQWGLSTLLPLPGTLRDLPKGAGAQGGGQVWSQVTRTESPFPLDSWEPGVGPAPGGGGSSGDTGLREAVLGGPGGPWSSCAVALCEPTAPTSAPPSSAKLLVVLP